jgi:hypothetical protein
MVRLLDRHPLRRGAHPSRDDGLCAMELVAWLAGEPHSDEPRCACPVAAAVVRASNDTLDDQDRERLLRPLVPLLVDSRATVAVERRRGFLVLDCLLRELLPQWLRQRQAGSAANELAALPPLADRAGLLAAQELVQRVAPGERGAAWTLQAAVAGVGPAQFATGLVHTARAVGTPAAWGSVQGLVLRLLAVTSADLAAV